MTAEGSGRVAVVTGASRGIGEAIARRLARSGHSVVVNYSASPAAAEAVVAGIVAEGGVAIAHQADVSDEDQVGEMFDTVTADLGPVAVLVNNAGITRDNLLVRMSHADFEDVLAVNLSSAFLCTKAALRSMIRLRWGRIVSISSVSGVTGNAGQANYSASKAGLIGFAKAVAKEYGGRNITSNVVAPGYIETAMTADLDPDTKKTAIATITLGRFGEPEDIAAAVDFLASDAAAYVTGQVLSVDGGIAL